MVKKNDVHPDRDVALKLPGAWLKDTCWVCGAEFTYKSNGSGIPRSICNRPSCLKTAKRSARERQHLISGSAGSVASRCKLPGCGVAIYAEEARDYCCAQHREEHKLFLSRGVQLRNTVVTHAPSLAETARSEFFKEGKPENQLVADEPENAPKPKPSGKNVFGLPDSKNCILCGTPFKPVTLRHAYCSIDCRNRSKGMEMCHKCGKWARLRDGLCQECSREKLGVKKKTTKRKYTKRKVTVDRPVAVASRGVGAASDIVLNAPSVMGFIHTQRVCTPSSLQEDLAGLDPEKRWGFIIYEPNR